MTNYTKQLLNAVGEGAAIGVLIYAAYLLASAIREGWQ